MALTRFKTDLRLWFWVSTFLFVAPWFLPIAGMKGSDWMSPILLCVGVIDENPGAGLVLIGFYILLFGIFALVFGWILHCVAVMVRRRWVKAHAGTTAK
jgi:hypothetical protein